MILCDFLSRVAADGGDPMDLVPVAFNGMSIIQDRNNHLEEYQIMTRNQRVTAGMSAPPPVHGANKAVNPNLKPERHALTPSGQNSLSKKTSDTTRPLTPMLTPSGKAQVAINNKTTTENRSQIAQKECLTQPINKDSLTQRHTDKDSNPKTLALTPRVNMPLGQLGPMPLVNVPSQEVIKAGRDLEPAPEIV